MSRRGMRYNCQLCYDIGVSESALSRWRAGRPFLLNHAVALSYCLGVSLDYLLIGEEPKDAAGDISMDINRFLGIYASLDATNRRLSLTLLRNLAARLDAPAVAGGAFLGVELPAAE